jgi:arginine utilization regulatory protein
MDKIKPLPSFEIMDKIYQKLLAEIDMGVHIIDENGKTIIYNHKMTEIEGMAASDVLNKSIQAVFSFQNKQNSTLVQALQKGKSTKEAKQTYFNNKGIEITTVNNTFPIIDQNKIIGAIEIANDITKIERFIRENVLKKGDTKYTFDSIIGNSEPIQDVIEASKRATRTNSSVLIIGETGTGKELFAQSIHNGSIRSKKAFVSQNCAALPDNLIEGLLFGTKKGAFTGAIERPGLFEQAEGGTILLDEINSLHPALQAKLLRAIQEKTIRRVGDTKDTKVDVRIIATINEDPIDAVADNRLRKDLYYRLSVVSIFIPPLKDRKEDIPLLVQSFIEKYNSLFDMHVNGIEKDVLTHFNTYDWPGNVRELEHVIEGALNSMEYEGFISYNHLPIQYRKRTKMKALQALDIEELTSNTRAKTLKEFVHDTEAYYINKILNKHNGNISHTAKFLGISRQSLQYRLRKLKVD